MSLQAEVVVRRGSFGLDVALEVADGETLAVLGPNGAGKSTLLRALAGLEPLTAGRVSCAGRVLTDVAAGVQVPVADRGVGVVFQDVRLFPHLTVAANVAFGPRLRAGRPAAQQQAGHWLAELGVAALGDRKPAQLSGGQAQRVAIARALAASPRMLLLDEPLSALDVEARDDVRRELRRVLRAFAGPSIVVTHDPLDAMSLGDRALVLDSGTVAQVGPFAELAGRPANGYVARLVGLTLLRGHAVGDVVQLDDGGHLVTGTPAQGPVSVVVRPSSVVVHTTEPALSSARNVWTATVASMESLGDRVRVLATGAPTVLADVTAAAAADLRLARGDQIWLSVKATELDVHPA